MCLHLAVINKFGIGHTDRCFGRRNSRIELKRNPGNSNFISVSELLFAGKWGVIDQRAITAVEVFDEVVPSLTNNSGVFPTGGSNADG